MEVSKFLAQTFMTKTSYFARQFCTQMAILHIYICNYYIGNFAHKRQFCTNNYYIWHFDTYQLLGYWLDIPWWLLGHMGSPLEILTLLTCIYYKVHQPSKDTTIFYMSHRQCKDSLRIVHTTILMCPLRYDMGQRPSKDAHRIYMYHLPSKDAHEILYGHRQLKDAHWILHGSSTIQGSPHGSTWVTNHPRMPT